MEKSKQEKQRTLPQNNSLHLFCTELATELNNSGITMQAFVENIEVDHTMFTVKAYMTAIAKAKYGKERTRDLTRTEVSAIYEEVNRHVSQWGIHIAWPSNEPPLLEEI